MINKLKEFFYKLISLKTVIKKKMKKLNKLVFNY